MQIHLQLWLLVSCNINMKAQQGQNQYLLVSDCTQQMVTNLTREGRKWWWKDNKDWQEDFEVGETDDSMQDKSKKTK